VTENFQRIDLSKRAFIYRLWNAKDECLYVGQHTGFHPAVRVAGHCRKPWWDDIAWADYFEVPSDTRDHAEKADMGIFN
jgi:hypothetical protein